MDVFLNLFLLLSITIPVFSKTLPREEAVIVDGNADGKIQNFPATSLESLAAPQPKAIATSNDNVCITPGCVEIAAFILKNIDVTSDPCQDFYQFACGKFMKRTVIPDDKGAKSVFDDVSESLEERMRLVLEEKSPANETKTARMTKNLYRSCVNETLAAELGLQPLKRIVGAMGGWPVVDEETWDKANFSMIEAMYKNHKFGFKTNSLFELKVTTDKANSSRRIIELDQPNLGLKREYIIKGAADSDFQAYLKYATGAAILLGAKPETAEVEIMKMLLFEMSLANISSPREERRNATKLYNLRTIQELEMMTPQVPWLEYINNLMPSSVQIGMDEKVVVSEPNFFQEFSILVNNTDKRTIANYVIWRVVEEAVAYLSEDIRNLKLELQKKLEGKTKQLPRWQECIRKLQKKFPFGLGYLYVKNYFNEEAKEQMTILVRYLKNSFDEILNSVDWMDELTRSKAMDKSRAMQPHIAYPNELIIDDIIEAYYGNLTISDNFYFANILNINNFQTNFDRSLLRDPVDKSDWKQQAKVAQVNAFYYWTENTMKLPAGILQGIFFELDYPQYVRFAGIGVVVGHEITHGFDDQGKQFDADGNLFNWWEPETEKKFHEKAKCIVQQYSNYTLPENGLQLNGINSQGEDIADNGGTKESYMAYQKWVHDNGPEPILPGLTYNSNQLFWISYAQKLCEISRPENAKKQVLTGVHTPKRFRIIGPLKNSNEFAKDFNCPVGSGMNPVDKCSVW